MTDRRSVLNGVQTVVFDLDGTFYDKQGLARRMVRRLWWSLPLMAIDRCARGPLWRWVVATSWHKEVYLKTMVELIRTTCPKRPEAQELLMECKRRGLRTALYSDYGRAEDKLRALEIDPQLFDLIITGSELGALKPSAGAARTVLERLNADPQTTLFVGDRDEKDGAAARSVGAHFLLL